MKALILAGGRGTRLWPRSREGLPKQFLCIGGERSYLQMTVTRLMTFMQVSDIFVLTSYENYYDVHAQLEKIEPRLLQNIFMEPQGRNTCPAIALGVKALSEKGHLAENEPIFITPSDHIIQPTDALATAVANAADMARCGQLVVFGIEPTHPATGYGYIKCGEGSAVDAFVEKPESLLAESYLAEGSYYWNSGMLCLTAEALKNELEVQDPDMAKVMEGPLVQMLQNFAHLPAVSFDCAILENSRNLAMIPLGVSWSDIGSWDSVYDVFDKDDDGNCCIGDVSTRGTTNSLVIGDRRLVATIDLDNCLIIDSPDALLVARRGCSEDVGSMVKELAASGRQEVIRPLTLHRPWGSFSLIESGSNYEIRHVLVNAGETIALQRHRERSEHWIIVRGKAEVSVADMCWTKVAGDSVYVAPGETHRLSNVGDSVLEVVEVQVGEQRHDGDIERLEADTIPNKS